MDDAKFTSHGWMDQWTMQMDYHTWVSLSSVCSSTIDCTKVLTGT